MACFKEWIKRGKEPRPSIGQIRIILTCKSSKTTLIELMKKNRGETKHVRSTLSKINKMYRNNNQIQRLCDLATTVITQNKCTEGNKRED